MHNSQWLLFERKVKFGDCDSAGVIHFHNLFRWSHESWEESIDIYGIKAIDIFPSSLSENNTIFPIIQSEAKFFSPIKHGQNIKIKILPSKINNYLFKVKTFFSLDNLPVGETLITHCAIDNISRQKVDIPDKLQLWIEASNIINTIKEC
tara:strand:- start:27 stop:476 length:450 start_codon:yes stop_codon:yes gene_type:complete